MSKQLVQMDMFPLIEQQVERTESQGKTIRTMLDGMKRMYSDFSEKFEEVQGMVREVRDSVTLTDAECYQLQSSVFSKSTALTKHRYTEEEGEFKDVVGKHRRMIWKKLKEKFEVARYSHIRRIDFQEAQDFVKHFRPEDYI